MDGQIQFIPTTITVIRAMCVCEIERKDSDATHQTQPATVRPTDHAMGQQRQWHTHTHTSPSEYALRIGMCATFSSI